ncbi:DEAD/DEAH box helicase [Bacillus lacus]|uniref:RNA helicase n=1 Tax=Metabacillus lacus TaxID=1983721 RepID=A0A7X2IXZ5_9BACI|nr:DEAD/DEAH box helicase [Metabacillus lacus]MRX71188.1 DEAD/DEAH box helicase [Metabacillus lacus]
MKTFVELGIQKALGEKLAQNGIHEPTPIQEKSIPPILENKDIIAKAQTGTGKTLAFLLPILEKAEPSKEGIEALIVTPTRELAIQITSEVKKLIEAVPEISALAVYGGQDVERQMKKLKGNISIVIGTPGRILDHVRRETIDLSSVRKLVLDEADQMLHIGFLGEVERIIAELPYERQTMLFSATISDQVRSLARKYLQNPVNIEVRHQREVTLREIQQTVVETTDRRKQQALIDMMREHQPFLAIIFCRTKRRASILNEALQQQGFLSDELHGDLSQAKRERVMASFREAKLQYLVATDVAARGLDVEGVTHVYNYDIPHDTESYIHRIGRTGRAGGTGVAITFAAPKDKQHLEQIEKETKQHIQKIVRDTIPEKPERERGAHKPRSSGKSFSPRKKAGDGGSNRGFGKKRGENTRNKKTR